MSNMLDNEIVHNMMQSIEHVRAAEATYRLYPQMVEAVIEKGFKSLVEKLKIAFPETEHQFAIHENFYSCAEVNALEIYKKNHPQIRVGLYFEKPNCQIASIGVFFSEEGKHTLKKYYKNIQQSLEDKLAKASDPNEWWPWDRYLSEPFNSSDDLELLLLFTKDDHEYLIKEFKAIMQAIEECFKEFPDIFSS